MKKLNLLFCCILFATISFGQWVQTDNSLSLGDINSLLAYDTKIYAATEGLGIFSTENGGISWSAENSGLGANYISDLAVKNNYLWASSTDDGVYEKNVGPSDWVHVTSGLTDSNVRSITATNDYVYAATASGIFTIDHYLSSWITVNDNLSNTDVYSVHANSSNLFAGCYNSFYSSLISPVYWNHIPDMDGHTVKSFVSYGTFLLAGTEGNGLYGSNNNGSTWWWSSTNWIVYDMAITENYLFAGTNNGFYYSDNNGGTWVLANEGLTNTVIRSLAVSTDGQYVYAGTNGEGVWKRAISNITNSIQDENIPFSITSNPGNGKYQISGEQLINAEFEVFDLTGKLILSSTFDQNGESSIDISSYSNGIYLLQVWSVNSDIFFSEKLVKQ